MKNDFNTTFVSSRQKRQSKKMIITLLCVMSLLAFTVACSKLNDINVGGGNNKSPDTTEFSLLNTKWKLEGIVNAETGVLTVLEPTSCSCAPETLVVIEDLECYMLIFDSETIFSGYSTNRYLQGEYSVNYATNDIHITMGPLICLDEVHFDGELYVQYLDEVLYYSLQHSGRKLQLFFNESNYLLFNRIF